MDYKGKGGFAGSERPDDQQVMQQVQAAMTAEYLQEFYSTVRDKCFAACVTSPGSSLSSSEQKCLSRCMDRYQEATTLMSKAVMSMAGDH